MADPEVGRPPPSILRDINESLVKRFLVAVVVAALLFGTSGIADMLRPEACAPGESASEHQECSATCVRCACCAQPIVQSATVDHPSGLILPSRAVLFAQNVVDDPQVRDITHVPKPRT